MNARTSGDRPLDLLPPYAVVLALAGLAGVAVAFHAAAVFHVAKAASSFPEDVRRTLTFALIFNAALAAGMALAWLGELVATAVRIARRVPAGRALARLVICLLPLVLFAVAHLAVNPWMGDLLGQLKALAQQGPRIPGVG